MRRTLWFIALAAVLFALAVTVPLAAQELPLTEKAAKKAIKAQDKLLKAADKAAQRGDNAAVERNLEEFAASTRGLNERLERGQVAQEDNLTVAEVVAQATSKHLDKLTELSGKFGCDATNPEAGDKACKGILTALSHADRGHTEAMARVASSPAGSRETGRPSDVGAASQAGRPSGTAGGRPETAGPPSPRPSGPPAGRPPKPPRP